MFKALLKKQLLELNSFYFMNKKTGKMRSKAGAVGFIILFAFIFFSVAVSLGSIDMLFALGILPQGLDWLYFAVIGIMSVVVGTFGSVFNTYAGLYNAKDNELLLSMPIAPSKILLVRMIGVYLMSLLYSGIAFIPGVVVYWILTPASALSVIFSVLLIFITALFVHVLTSALGFVVALVASKLKNKAITTVILSLFLLAIYYLFYFRINSILSYIIENASQIGDKVYAYILPFYHLGRAAGGNIASMLLFTLFVGVLFALTCFILSKTFIKIVTTNKGQKSKGAKAAKAKAHSASRALFGKELRRFVSSPAYMLNCGLALVIMTAVSVAAIVKAKTLGAIVSELLAQSPAFASLIPIACAAVVMIISSTCYISAPSVSLEGKSIWILRSLPVRENEIMKAKEKLHIVLCAPLTVVTSVVLGSVFDIGLLNTIAAAALNIIFVCLMSSLGLMIGTLKPTLEWTSEAIPVKQGLPAVVSLFGGFFIVIISVVPYFFLSLFIKPVYYMLAVAVLFAVAFVLVRKWNLTKGARRFSKL